MPFGAPARIAENSRATLSGIRARDGAFSHQQPKHTVGDIRV